MSKTSSGSKSLTLIRGILEGGELIDDTSTAITHFRTKNLSIMAAISLSKTDTGSLLALLEEIDSSFSQSIDVRKFSFNFCGEYQETFLVLWVRYLSAVHGKKSMFYTLDVDEKKMVDQDEDDDDSSKDNKMPRDDDDSDKQGEGKKQEEQDDNDQNQKVQDSVSVEHIFNSTYSHFLHFLIFLMSLPNNECFCWVFWIFFSLPKLQPSPVNLPRLIQLLWGTAEKTRFARNATKRKAVGLIHTVDPTQLNGETLKSIDLRAGGPWSTPVTQLKAVLTKKIFGTLFWKRVAAKFHKAARNWPKSYQTVSNDDDRDFKRVGVNSRADVVHIVRGDIKAARKELRHFIRANQNYQFVLKTSFGTSGMSTEPEQIDNREEVGNKNNEDDDDDEEEVESASGGLVGYILRSLLGNRVRSTAPSVSSSRDQAQVDVGPSKAASMKERIQRRQVEERKKEKEKEQGGDGTRTYIPLEIQYKEALHLSHSHLNERSQSSIAGAEELLQACSDDILFTIKVPTVTAMEEVNDNDENEEEDENVGQLPDVDDSQDDDPDKSSRNIEKGDEDDNENGEENDDDEDEEEEGGEGEDESSNRRYAAEGDED